MLNKKTVIIPVGKKVLIKPKGQLKFVPGTNIILPENALEKEYKGFVIAVGEEVTEIKIGDQIQYADYTVPTQLKHNSEDHLLINIGDIFAIVIED
tara:strand:- start:315 stop:602 length:288 start_codon:yes stop_codon:yes gene_type:complete